MADQDPTTFTERELLNRVFNNTPFTAYASAARTASPADAVFVNYGYLGVMIVIDVTAVTATPSVVFNIEGVDSLSGKVWTLLASAAITGTGTTVLEVHPGITASTNVRAKGAVPRNWQINPVHADADSITYSVAVHPIIK